MADIHTIVMNLGDLAGVTALAIQTDPARVGIWHPRLGLPSGPALTQAMTRQTEVFAIDHVTIVDPFYEPRSAMNLDPAGVDASVVLLAAARHAVKLDCGKLVWPIQCGAEYDAVSMALQRAQLVTHLIELDLPGEPLVIDMPFVDLTDQQLGEIALHADAPVHAAWWCEYDRKTPCGGCDSCLRWRSVADAAVPPGLVGR
ncbi:MAG: 7-cyano-7-deazaguanine synthase [Phycisphaerales bacterium]|nr:7-cyano-7-deazaguanine synthase [Phycisphaerales bacterium]